MKTFLKLLVGILLTVGLFTFAFYRTPQERAFAKNLKLAQAGDSAAALAVASAYEKGEGTKPNKQQALSWYEQAAARGSTQASLELFQIYTKGTLAPADPQAAFTYLQVAAQADDPSAQYELGNQYMQGNLLVPAHRGQAYYWYMTAAQNGSTAAKAKVDALSTEDPTLYESVTRFVQALQSAQGPDAQAQLEVGQAYRYGSPVLQDDTLAAKWFKTAWETSKQELSPAAYELAQQYASGEGVEKDEAQAADLFAQAAELKNAAAQYQMGVLAYGDNPARLEDAFAWFSNAATQGHAQAQYMTGFMLMQGQGTQPSVPLAIRFFEQAAEQNDPSAQYVLGQIYTKGLGVKKNPSAGRNWLERAAENGNEQARTLLGL